LAADAALLLLHSEQRADEEPPPGDRDRSGYLGMDITTDGASVTIH
jgi:hypothetical protein